MLSGGLRATGVGRVLIGVSRGVRVLVGARVRAQVLRLPGAAATGVAAVAAGLGLVGILAGVGVVGRRRVGAVRNRLVPTGVGRVLIGVSRGVRVLVSVVAVWYRACACPEPPHPAPQLSCWTGSGRHPGWCRRRCTPTSRRCSSPSGRHRRWSRPDRRQPRSTRLGRRRRSGRAPAPGRSHRTRHRSPTSCPETARRPGWSRRRWTPRRSPSSRRSASHRRWSRPGRRQPTSPRPGRCTRTAQTLGLAGAAAAAAQLYAAGLGLVGALVGSSAVFDAEELKPSWSRYWSAELSPPVRHRRRRDTARWR